jgi:hypothetical protein
MTGSVLARVCALIIAMTAADAQAAASDLVRADPAGIPGSVTVLCERTGGGFTRMRGSVVRQSGYAAGDIVLTAAHGIPAGPGTPRCEVRALGAGAPVARMEVAPRIGASPDDWAVLVTSELLPREVERLALAVSGPEPLTSEMPVSLSWSSSAGRSCTLDADAGMAGLADHMRSHDCGSLPGMSGAPLIVATESGARMVAAINMGRLKRLDGEGEGVHPYARMIDPGIIETINLVIAETIGG